MNDIIDKVHFQDLAEKDPGDVCTRAMCAFDPENGHYTLALWGAELRIDPRRCKIEWLGSADNRFDEYWELVGIHYLLGARAIDPIGEWISEKDIPGGPTFFRGPHRIPSELITQRFDNDLDLFRSRCAQLGGAPLDMADAAFVLRMTPRVPVAVLYWAGDDDFPAEAKILFDRTIVRHFATDIVYALAVGVCRLLAVRNP